MLFYSSDVGDSPSDHAQEDVDSEVYPSEDGEYGSQRFTCIWKYIWRVIQAG